MKKNYLARFILSFAITILFWQASSGQTETCPADMIHYWSFDENTSTGPYSDLFGLDADCSSLIGTNCPIPIPEVDPVGASAINFFNSNSYAVDIPDDNSFDWAADDSFTIQFWFLSDAATFTENQVVVARDARGGGQGLHWWVGMEGDPSDGTGNDGTVRFQLRDINDDPLSPYLGGTGTKINDNNWHLITAVRDESINQNRVYVDGVLIDSETFNYTGGFASDVIMTVGYLFNPIQTQRFFLDAKVDELALFNRALSQSEITNHYNIGINNKLGFCAKSPEITSSPITTAKVGAPYTYDVEVSANPAPTFTLENTPPSGMTIDAATGVINWTPTAGQEGNQNVRVKAENVLGNDIQDFVINVALENEPPSFTIGPDQETEEDSGGQVVSGWATNIDDGEPDATQVLTFNIKNNSNTSLFAAGPSVDAQTGDLSYTPAADANGTATITIDLSDAGGAVSGEQSFVITVTPVNDAPTFTIGDDQTVSSDNGLTIIQGWATNIDDGDPGPSENQVLTFEITSNNNVGLFSEGPSVNAVGDLSFTPMEGTAGVASITIVLKDDGPDVAPNVNESEEQTFNITVQEAVGIDQEDISRSLNVFPNPSSNRFVNIRLENEVVGAFKIDVFALNGKSLYSDSFQKRGMIYEQQIDIDNLPRGIFVLRILNDQFIAEKRIVIN